MRCGLWSHDKIHQHGKTSSGSQRYRCLNCKQTFTSTFDTIYDRWQVSFEEVRIVLQLHYEGTSLRGISRISGLSYNTRASLIRAASQKAQMVHNAEVQDVQTDAIAADELWSFVKKTTAMLAGSARSWRLLDSIMVLRVRGRADLTPEPWTWRDIAVYPTLC